MIWISWKENALLRIRTLPGSGGACLLIPALRRQGEVDIWVRGHPGLQSEFQNSWDYLEKPCLKKTERKKRKTNKTEKEKKIRGSFGIHLSTVHGNYQKLKLKWWGSQHLQAQHSEAGGSLWVWSQPGLWSTSRTAKAMQRNRVSKNQTKQTCNKTKVCVSLHTILPLVLLPSFLHFPTCGALSVFHVTSTFLFLKIYLFYLYECLPTHMYMRHVYVCPTHLRGHWVPWNWSYGWLWGAMGSSNLNHSCKSNKCF